MHDTINTDAVVNEALIASLTDLAATQSGTAGVAGEFAVREPVEGDTIDAVFQPEATIH